MPGRGKVRSGRVISVDDGNRQITGDRVAAEASAKKFTDGRPSVGGVGSGMQPDDAERAGASPLLDDLALCLAPRSLANREQREHSRILQILCHDVANRSGVPEAESAEYGDLLQHLRGGAQRLMRTSHRRLPRSVPVRRYVAHIQQLAHSSFLPSLASDSPRAQPATPRWPAKRHMSGRPAAQSSPRSTIMRAGATSKSLAACPHET